MDEGQKRQISEHAVHSAAQKGNSEAGQTCMQFFSHILKKRMSPRLLW